MCFVQNNEVNSAVENIVVSDQVTQKCHSEQTLARQMIGWDLLVAIFCCWSSSCVDRFLHQGPLSSCQCGELQNLFWPILTVICCLRICSL